MTHDGQLAVVLLVIVVVATIIGVVRAWKNGTFDTEEFTPLLRQNRRGRARSMRRRHRKARHLKH